MIFKYDFDMTGIENINKSQYCLPLSLINELATAPKQYIKGADR